MTQPKKLSFLENTKFKKNYLIYKGSGFNSKVSYLGPKVIYFQMRYISADYLEINRE